MNCVSVEMNPPDPGDLMSHVCYSSQVDILAACDCSPIDSNVPRHAQVSLSVLLNVVFRIGRCARPAATSVRGQCKAHRIGRHIQGPDVSIPREVLRLVPRA